MNQGKHTMFMRMHPLVNVTYFLVMMLFTMFYSHPVLLGITAVSSFAYLCYLGGKTQFKWNLMLIPLMLLLSLINPLFNRTGNTVLFYLFHKPVTLEAAIYGVFASLMIYDMILLFRIFHIVMTSDKIICIFSKILPIGSLLFTMTLRFVPMYKAQIHKMRTAQKGIGRDFSQGTLLEKAKHGVELISGLLTWALENALETSDSMKGRGFGLGQRTYYANTHMTRLDWQVFGFELLCAVGMFYSAALRCFHITYYPVMEWKWSGVRELCGYGLFLLFALIPVLLDGKEEITWIYLKQKI